MWFCNGFAMVVYCLLTVASVQELEKVSMVRCGIWM